MAGGLNPGTLRRRPGRRAAAAALLVGVLLVHLQLGDQLLQAAWVGRFGGDLRADDRPRRIQVAFVRELQPAAPPAPVLPPPPPARPRPAHLPVVAQAPLPAPEPAASVPVPPPLVPAEPEPAPAPPVPEPGPATDQLAQAGDTPAPPVLPVAAAPAQGAASAADGVATPFSWPPSTRLSYTLGGQYRGDLHGSASVEWVREGTHYQVHLNALVGPSFAPLMARRLSSDGELGEAGLVPQRFDGEQRIGFGTRRWTLQFEPRRVTLSDGRQQDALPGVQDEASQFVQLAWLFNTQPQRLSVGQSVEMPLALPRRQDRWIYDVVAETTLALPFGPLPAFHLKPRREGRPGELTAQIWVAPTLQYLPVRILIHQDSATFVDLMLEKPPLQALR